MLEPSDAAFGAFVACKSVDIRASRAGVGVRLGVRTWDIAGESVPVLARMGNGNGVIELEARRSTERLCFLCVERGESTVTTGGDGRDGVV